MDLPAFRRLLAPEGQAALAAAVELRPSTSTLLACHKQLRKQYADDLVRTALDTALLRQKAAGKFTRADRMYFTREALEQASGEVISTYRGRRFAGFRRVGDFCCGIGGDTIGLAMVTEVIAVDADPVRTAMAEENLRVYGRDRVTFECADVLTMRIPPLEAAFIDPDRRAGGRRRLRIREYAPSLDAVRVRLAADFALGVKVAPGVTWDEVLGFDAEAEFISVDGELKECVLWFGQLKSVGRRATVLPAGETLADDQPAILVDPGPPLDYLYDPDPAIVRSGVVANLGQLIGARPIDPEIAYLTSERYTPTPFARAYRVEESMPFHSRQLANRLRSMNVGTVTLTKRGSAVDPHELLRQWRLTGSETRTVILTRVQGKPFALIGYPAGNDGPTVN